MTFFDGTWGRRQFIREVDSLDLEVWLSMSIEERNRTLDLYEAYIQQLAPERY
jgi:hypothetical protein